MSPLDKDCLLSLRIFAFVRIREGGRSAYNLTLPLGRGPPPSGEGRRRRLLLRVCY